MKRYLAAAAFLASIVAANILAARYGLVPVGFGLLVSAGSFAAGAALVARDFVQETTRRPSCRNQIVEPFAAPALDALDLTLDPGQKIGERVDKKGRPDPLEPATLARVGAALDKIAGGLLAPAGGTWRESATSLGEPMPTRTTRETDGIVLPPALLVPQAARANDAYGTDRPFRTQTCRAETGLAIPPFIASLRGGGSKKSARTLDEPLLTFSASGQHHALVNPPENFLLSYYGNGTGHSVEKPIGTLTTKDRYALVGVPELPKVEDCTFRMLALPEIAAGMAFASDFKVKGTKRQIVCGYGNAVCPPAAEVLYSALVECILGQELPRYAADLAA